MLCQFKKRLYHTYTAFVFLLLLCLLEQKVPGQLLSLVALSIYPPTADTFLSHQHMWLNGLVSRLSPAGILRRSKGPMYHD
jgi:hypothetical protein